MGRAVLPQPPPTRAPRRYQTPSGTDINKVGIAPTIKLTAEQMPPLGPDTFCSALQGPAAPRLFK